MFHKKELEAYRAIQAPDVLYQRVIGSQKQSRRWILPVAGSLAAGFLLVIAIGFLIRSGAPGIVLNGQELEDTIVFYDISPASDMRSSPVFSVPVELALTRETEISVSHGCMTVDGEKPAMALTADSSVTIWWEIERSEVMPVCEMEIRDQSGVTFITLEYNNAEITATKRSN